MEGCIWCARDNGESVGPSYLCQYQPIVCLCAYTAEPTAEPTEEELVERVVLHYVLTLYPYTANGTNVLSFNKGVKLEVLNNE